MMVSISTRPHCVNQLGEASECAPPFTHRSLSSPHPKIVRTLHWSRRVQPDIKGMALQRVVMFCLVTVAFWTKSAQEAWVGSL